MNIDERLEALTQTVELLAAMHRDNETRYDRTTRDVQELTRDVQDLARAQRALTRDVQDLTHAVHELVRLTQQHHDRLTHLEGDAA